MTRIELAPEVLDDFERIFDHTAAFNLPDRTERILEVIDAIQILAHSPLIGRPAGGGKRELVIGRGGRGYVALCRYVDAIDTIFILTIRHQSERGFERCG
jgi:plasmid stabilization system protein ParE